jgi:hypothetical protein
MKIQGENKAAFFGRTPRFYFRDFNSKNLVSLSRPAPPCFQRSDINT